MPDVDEFGGVALDSPDTDEFGGIAVDGPDIDEFGGVAVYDGPSVRVPADTLPSFFTPAEQPESAQSINRFFAQAAVDRQDSPNMAGAKAAWESLVTPQVNINRVEGRPDDSTVQKVSGGLYNAGAGLLEFFTSPLGIATAGLGAMPAAVQKVAGGAFAADLSTHLPEVAYGISEAVKAGDTQKAVELSASGAIQLAAIGGGMKHAIGKAKVEPPPLPKLRDKEIQGDFDSAVKDSLSLQGEEAVDLVKASKDKADAKLAADEAKRIQDEQQGKLFEPPPTEPKGPGMGAAIPEEFGKPGDYVSNMFAAIDRDRAAMGKPPMPDTVRRTWDEDNAKALTKMNRDPNWIPDLIAEVTAKPRPLLSWENAGVVWQRAHWKGEANNALSRIAKAFDDGRLDDLASARAEAVRFEEKINTLDEAVGRNGTGSEAGRSLQAQKMAAGNDFSLVEMRLEKRNSANEGGPLTEKQERDVSDLHKQLAEARQNLVDAESKAINLASEREAARVIEELKAKKATPAASPYVIQIAEKFVVGLDKRADAARVRLREKLSRMSGPTGIDPTILLDVAEIGAAHIGHIGLDFARWSKVMLDDVGAFIEPHLKEAFDASKKFIDDQSEVAFKGNKLKEPIKRAITKATVAEQKEATTKNIKSKLDSKKRGEVANLVQRLARLFVEDGIKERNALIDSVHEVLKGIDPEFTRRETMDAISGYGDFKQLSKSEISKQLRDLKGQMQQVAKLEDMQAGNPPLKTGLERRIPSSEESRLIKLVNEAKQQFQIPITDPNTQLKSSLDTLKTRMKNRADELERKLSDGDFTTRPKREIALDPDAIEARRRLDVVKRKWQEGLIKDKLSKRSLPKKIFDTAVNTLNLSRTFITSLDFSGVLRQGGFIGFGNPARSIKNIPDMFRAGFSQSAAYRIAEGIRRRDNYFKYKRDGLFLSEESGSISAMEEAYMGRWTEKVWGVHGSQRAYTTFLNKLRADSYDAMAKAYGENLPPEAGKALANYINVATGRGSFGAKETVANGLNTFFFSPRYLASRFQLLSAQPLWKGDARTRALIAKEYVKYLVGMGVVYSLAKFSGAEVETDWKSSDFGKFRFGNVRVDPLSGLSQSTVLLGREITGKTKDISGNERSISGGVPFGKGNRADVLMRFLRTKLAPVPAVVGDVLNEKDLNQKPVTVAGEIKKLTVPISFEDIYKALKEEGIGEGAALGLLSTFGMGIQVYDEKESRK